MILPTKQEWDMMLPSAKLRVFESSLCDDCEYYHVCYNGGTCPFDRLTDDEKLQKAVNFKRRLDDEKE